MSVLAIVSCLVLAPALARADEGAPDPLVAFEEGRSLVKTGHFAEALTKFEESYRLKATSGALLNMADCFEKLGRYASAVSAFERASALAVEHDHAERAQVAKERLAALAPIVSKLTVRSPNRTAVTVTVDGRPAPLDQARSVDGGEHIVRVEAPCRTPNEIRVSVGLRDDDRVIVAELGGPSASPACGGPAPTLDVVSPPMTTSSWSTQKTVAVVLGGASLVALGAGIAFGLKASSKKDELDGACRDYPNGCPIGRRDELETTYDDAGRAAAYSTMGIIAGVVFLGAAVGLYLTAPKTTTRTASTPLAVAF